MKLLANLFILIAMVLIVVGVISRFFETVIVFQGVSPLAHIVFANTCLLIALVLKLAKD